MPINIKSSFPPGDQRLREAYLPEEGGCQPNLSSLKVVNIRKTEKKLATILKYLRYLQIVLREKARTCQVIFSHCIGSCLQKYPQTRQKLIKTHTIKTTKV